MARKDELRRRIEADRAELERLESLPDFDAMPSGTIIAVGLKSRASHKMYPHVGLKIRNRWFFTGPGDRPDGATGEQVADRIMGPARTAVSVVEVAVIEMASEPVVDLGTALLNSLRDPSVAGAVYAFAPDDVISDFESRPCAIPDCGCVGGSHP